MKKQLPIHENLGRHDGTKMGSDRNFGFVFAAFCAIVAGYIFWKTRTAAWGWIAAATIFAGLAIFLPRALRPLNILWFKFGLLLHYIMNPLVLGLMFYVIFTPVGMLMRLTGQRPLNLPFDKQTESYWVLRKPPGPPPGSFKNQF